MSLETLSKLLVTTEEYIAFISTTVAIHSILLEKSAGAKGVCVCCAPHEAGKVGRRIRPPYLPSRACIMAGMAGMARLG